MQNFSMTFLRNLVLYEIDHKNGCNLFLIGLAMTQNTSVHNMSGRSEFDAE